jgi:hypothetical protein
MLKVSSVGVKCAVVSALLGWTAAAWAIDDWDAAVVKDNTAGTTKNLLNRGAIQTHDLQAVGGVADEDWFIISVSAFRQYQIYLAEATPDTPVANADFLELYNFDGSTLIQQATIGVTGAEKLIRFFAGADTIFLVRVKGNTNSPATSRYGISYAESTMYCPRYNNSGTQVSVLLVQNTQNSNCNIAVDFYTESGTFLHTHNATVNTAGMAVVPLGGIPQLAGQKGSARLHPFCSPSGLKAKLVALEPSTGFSFDTLCERR